jgi:uncharacterized membrane protein
MQIASIIHGIGTGLGLLCALVSAGLMLNLKTDEQKLRRARTARRIAPVTWLAFIILIISGVVLTVNQTGSNVTLLVIKHVLVAVLLTDALIIHFRFFPRYFKQLGTAEFSNNYTAMRRVGALSVSCWIVIVILSVLLTRIS